MGNLTASVYKVETVVVPDTDADPGEGGDSGAVGVYMAAEIRFATPEGGWIVGPEIRTTGIWGVLDATPEYLSQLANEESEELVEMLAALGLKIPDAADAE